MPLPMLRHLSDSPSGESCLGMNRRHPLRPTASHEALNQCDKTVSSLFQDDADHLITYASCFWESRFKVLRDAFETILVRRKIAKGDAVRPPASGKRKLQIIRTKSIVLDSRVDDFFKELRLAEEVLGNSEPESERLGRSRLELRLASRDRSDCHSQGWSRSYDRRVRCLVSTSSQPWPKDSSGCLASSPLAPSQAKIDPERRLSRADLSD